MKWLLALFLLLGLFAKQAQACLSDSTKTDTTLQVVVVTPYLRMDAQSSGVYLKQLSTLGSFGLNNGVGVFNLLRGRVPSLLLRTDFQTFDTFFTRQAPFDNVYMQQLIVDGVSFSGSFFNNLNTNGFDYQSIAVVSNSSTLNFIDGSSGTSYVLRSKSGEDVRGPSWEVGNFTNYEWSNTDRYGQLGGMPVKERVDLWHLSQSLAFAQDFGAVDLRVSYTTKKFLQDSPNAIRKHHLKVNTGWTPGSRLRLRLVVDSNLERKVDADLALPLSKSPPVNLQGFTYKVSSVDALLATNLTAAYQMAKGWYISSQITTADLWSQYQSTVQLRQSEYNRTDSRWKANLFVNGSKAFGKQSLITGFAGFEYEDRFYFSEYKSLGGSWSNFSEPLGLSWSPSSSLELVGQIPKAVVQVQTNWGQRLFITANGAAGLREFFHMNRPGRALSLSSSYRLFHHPGTRGLNTASFRASAGLHRSFLFPRYPYLSQTYLPESYWQSPYVPTDVQNLEVGLDMSFLNSRFDVRTNYFINSEVKEQVANYYFVGPDGRRSTGWEADVEYQSSSHRTVLWKANLVFAQQVERLHASDSWRSSYRSFSQLSLWNKLSVKKFFASTVLEGVRSASFDEFNYLAVRDISIGLKLPVRIAASITLSGRNLYLITPQQNSIQSTIDQARAKKSVNLGFQIAI